MLGPPQFKASQVLVGFTDDVSFQNIARIQQNDTSVGNVSLWHNGKQVKGGIPLLLRGVTLDTYTGKDGGYRWVRWPRQTGRDAGPDALRSAPDTVEDEPNTTPVIQDELTRETPTRILGPSDPAPVEPKDKWVQKIRLLPTGTDVLFGMAGLYSITSHRPLNYRFWSRDGILRNIGLHDHDRPADATDYEVVSGNELGNTPPPVQSGTDPAPGGVIAKEIRDYALRPEVSGTEAGRPLAAARHARFQKSPKPTAEPFFDSYQADDADEEIAKNIEHHLRTEFAYTLDLTDTRRIEGRDPMVAFLYDFKRGHCEYFAGAMTLLCQSLGMKARMCLGFRTDEYNATLGADYYVVRQSHAHAWVEVFTKKGWLTFDPTSDRDSAVQASRAGWGQKIRHLFDSLEYNYGNTIIGYSNEDRINLFQATEAALIQTTMRSREFERFRHSRIDQILSSKGFWTFSSGALATVMGLMVLAVLVIVARFVWDKWELKKRAMRIGLDSLPLDEQLRLRGSLSFTMNCWGCWIGTGLSDGPARRLWNLAGRCCSCRARRTTRSAA